MKYITFIPALAVVSALVVLAGSAKGGVTPRLDGSFDVSTDRIVYNYRPDGMVTLSQFGVTADTGTRRAVFTFVSAGPFDPLDIPREHGRTVSVVGSKASMETHDTPHAILLYRAAEPGNITFSLDSTMGVVSFGSWALLGDSLIKADMAVTSGRTIAKSVDSLMIRLQSLDTLAFRVQGPSGNIGELLASGNLDAELDLRVGGSTLDSDLTAYERDASLGVESIGSSRASFTFGGFATSSVAIIDLSLDLYAPLKDHLTLSVGGQTLSRFSDADGLLRSSGPGYAVAEGPHYVELFVRPGTSSGSIVAESLVPGLDPLMAVAALASAFVCVAAAVFLFRRKRQ